MRERKPTIATVVEEMVTFPGTVLRRQGSASNATKKDTLPRIAQADKIEMASYRCLISY